MRFNLLKQIFPFLIITLIINLLLQLLGNLELVLLLLLSSFKLLF